MLRTIQVDKYTISQAGMREAVRRATMVKKLQESASKLDEETLLVMAIYPQIAGCVTPIITLEQFLQMPEQELDKLTEAAMELNPHWFALDPVEQEKKTEPQPTPSTENSMPS